VSTKNHWSTSTINVTIAINGQVGDFQLVYNEQEVIKLGASAYGPIVIDVIFNQILQTITNCGTSMKVLHSKRNERIVMSHIVEQLDWERYMNIGSATLSRPLSKVVQYFNIADSVIEFDETSWTHDFLVVKNLRDNSCSCRRCKARSILEDSIFNIQSSALNHLLDRACHICGTRLFRGRLGGGGTLALRFIRWHC
jgi:hypothetical protein